MKKRAHSTRRTNRNHKAARKTARAIRQKRGGTAPTTSRQETSINLLSNILFKINGFEKEIKMISEDVSDVADSIINNINLIRYGAYDEETTDKLSDLLHTTEDELANLTTVLANSIDDEIEKLKTMLPEAITLIKEQVV